MTDHGGALDLRLRRQAWRRVFACPVFIVPFVIYLALEFSGWRIWLWVLVVALLAVAVSVTAGARVASPRHQYGRVEAALLSFGLGAIALTVARATGNVTEYYALASLAMVYLMVYWFIDSLRIIRATAQA
jgi:hypothetical protein